MNRHRRRALIALAAVLLALGTFAGPTSPASANPSFTNLQGSTYTPRYSSSGCLYRTIYFNLGSIPIADVRLYGSGCTNVSVGVAGHDGTTITWTWNHANPTPTGTDGCGAYSLLQVLGAQPGISVGASVIATNTWHAFRYDGTSAAPPIVPC